MKKIIIYGAGNFYKEHIDELYKRYDIRLIVDKYKKKETLEDGCVNDLSCIRNIQYDEIIIMIKDIYQLFEAAKDICSEIDIDISKLSFGINIFDKSICEEIYPVSYENKKIEIMVKINGIKCIVSSVDEYNNIVEVLYNQNYHYFINNEKKDVIIDVGLNIGAASIYFLNKKNVEKIYGYEPFKDTFTKAKKNLKQYLQDKETYNIEIFNFGLSNKNENRKILYNENMSCGMSTITENETMINNKYLNMGIASINDNRIEEVMVKNSTDIFSEIINKHPKCNIVLKMDCEGEEFFIIEDIRNSGILEQIDLIMLEWHYKSSKKILEALKDKGFHYWSVDKSKEMGMIYAIKK